MSLAGPYVAACCLLALAGVMKAHRPGDTARALQRAVPVLSLSATSAVLCGLAAAEAVLGVAALFLPRRPLAAAVCASYLLFAAFAAYVRKRGGPLASCGCFGTADTPASWLHVALDLLLAGAAGAMAADLPRRSVLGELAGQPLHGVPLLAAAGVLTWLVFIALGPAARLAALRAPGSSGASPTQGADPREARGR